MKTFHSALQVNKQALSKGFTSPQILRTQYFPLIYFIFPLLWSEDQKMPWSSFFCFHKCSKANTFRKLCFVPKSKKFFGAIHGKHNPLYVSLHYLTGQSLFLHPNALQLSPSLISLNSFLRTFLSRYRQKCLIDSTWEKYRIFLPNVLTYL